MIEESIERIENLNYYDSDIKTVQECIEANALELEKRKELIDKCESLPEERQKELFAKISAMNILTEHDEKISDYTIEKLKELYKN